MKFSELHPALIVRISACLYLCHLLFSVKIALVENFAWWTMFYLGWAVWRREARFSWNDLYVPLIVYGVVSSVSSFASGQQIHAHYEGMLWFKMMIFPVAVILYREVPRLRELATYVLGVVAGGGATWGLIEFVFFDRRDLEHRINGPSSHVMTFSGILLPLSLMMLILWWRQRKWWQIAACSLSTLTLLLTFTRSVWLGWAAAVCVLLALARARLAFYALPVVILFITFLPMPLFSRLVSTFDMSQSSNFDRIRMLEAGVEMIKDRPLLGVGPANVKEVYALYRKPDAPRPRPPHLHNNVVQLWAERGILGLGAYLAFLILFLRDCVKGWKGPHRMWAEIGVAAAVSLTVAGLFEFNFGDTEVFFLTLSLFALVSTALEQPQRAMNEVAPELVPATT
jgi:hypothetical protein